MKIVVKVLKGLFVFLLLIIVVSFFLPSKSHIERATVINAPAKIIFGEINNLSNWEKWSPWEHKDPNMVKTYSAKTEGVGASFSWKGNSDVGEGTMSIAESFADDSIQAIMMMQGMGKSYASFKLKKEEGGVKVIWAMDSKNADMPWDFKVPSKYFTLFADKMIGPDFEKGLADLKIASEKAAAETLIPVKHELIIETTKSMAQVIASYRMKTTLKTISGDIVNSYGRIGMFMRKNNMQQIGSPITFYHSFSPESIDMECAIPMNKMIKGEGEIKTSEMKAQNAVVAHYYGAYDKSGTAHDAIQKWAKEHNKKINGIPWEVYVTDPMLEHDTAKWLTDVYYPIE